MDELSIDTIDEANDALDAWQDAEARSMKKLEKSTKMPDNKRVIRKR